MIDRKALLEDLKRLLPRLEEDILAYSAGTEREQHLKQEHASAREAGRTAEHFIDFQKAQITQSAAAWVLACVFLRFLEDNDLLSEPMLAGPSGDRLQHARDRIAVHFREHPSHAERDYLLSVFDELEQLPTMGALLDRRHNPLWQLPLSDDGARALVDFFQRIDPESGELVHDFTDPDWDTRFLGDLYQDLSEAVRKRYALLQTPDFVESFILDYTLDKARDTFGLPGLRMIDPTCGSGHFLLTAFERLFDAWTKREPGTNTRHLAQKALDAVYGVDINPYAIAIARFRLLMAAMRASGSAKLRNAPDFRFNLAVGDSLLHGPRHEFAGQGIQRDALDDPIQHVLEVEDREQLSRILGRRYHVVVGNPPYITVKDKALNGAYRARYLTCHRQYSLGVPFTERFFDLCEPGSASEESGFVGMITANSFMKREFGKKLIEEYLPTKGVTHVIDTSGAYIPGHSTPTVILFARNKLCQAGIVRAVQGIRGEPSTPFDPAAGLVWESISQHADEAGYSNLFVSVVDQDRSLYSTHPWSVGGGGASDLKAKMEAVASDTLGTHASEIGFGAVTREDDAYFLGRRTCHRQRVSPDFVRPLVEGEIVRDWSLDSPTEGLWPYGDKDYRASLDQSGSRLLWPLRTQLSRRVAYGQSQIERGLHWFEYSMFFSDRYSVPLSICYAFVATHNHFVLDRGGKVFKQTAPVIKLPKGAAEAEHLALLGLLNSSTACFWMKQVFQGKHISPEPEYTRFEYASTGLKSLPIANDPDHSALKLAEQLDALAQSLAAQDPSAVLANDPPDPALALTESRADSESRWRKMIALQEELDWCCYRLYGLIEENLNHEGDPPAVQLGERPFEICLARQMAAGESESTWFERHGSTPITEIPEHWPPDYRALIERRMAAAESNPSIALIEQPEYKRRWNREPWAKRQEAAIKDWLLDHLEASMPRTSHPGLLTCAQLADRVRDGARFQQIAALYTGTDTFDAQALVAELVAGEQVPQYATGRYKPKAMDKFRAWQATWDLQRREDAIDARTELDPDHPEYLSVDAARDLKAREVGDIPVPPKYASGDFRKTSYWTLRGKLDVPRERFFSLPLCEKPGDGTLVIGWAGLDYLERTQAIAGWYYDRKNSDGWSAERLLPLLVAWDELLPWVLQWHNELDPEFGDRAGEVLEGQLLEELRSLGISRDALRAWEMPAQATRGRRRKAG